MRERKHRPLSEHSKFIAHQDFLQSFLAEMLPVKRDVRAFVRHFGMEARRTVPSRVMPEPEIYIPNLLGIVFSFCLYQTQEDIKDSSFY